MAVPLVLNMVLLLWVFLLASSFIVSATLVPYASPLFSTWLRFLLACLCLLPLVYRQLGPYLQIGILARYGLTSLCLMLFFIGLFEALKTTTALQTSVIYTLVPLLSVGLGYLIAGTVAKGCQLLGFLIGVAGAIWVLMGSGQGGLQSLHWQQGDLICLLACISLALHVVLARRWSALAPPQLGAFLLLLCGSMIMLPWVLWQGGWQQVHWAEAAFWQGLLYLTLFATIATAFLQQSLLRYTGPERLVAFTYLVPGLVLLLQGQVAVLLSPAVLPGVGLTALALYLITRSSIRATGGAS